MMNEDPIKYYAKRSSEYEQIYDKPERQSDLALLKELLVNSFDGKKVFEIACGTGYWTQVISENASIIHASDINQSVVNIAKTKEYGCPVTFDLLDIYNLKSSEEKYQSGFAGFIWSHIPKQKLNEFLNAFTARIDKGGTVVFVDNNYVKGSNTPISDIDSYGNQYQNRELKDGSLHKVMKNFPTVEELKIIVKPFGDNIEVIQFRYYWVLKFKVK